MKKIGITINDVISDFSGKFKDIYNSTYPDKKIEHVDIYNLEQYFNTTEEAHEFVYSETLFELFACSFEVIQGVMSQLNTLSDIMKNEGYELSIVSDENGKVRCAILHFLSKIFCQLDNIVFIPKMADFEKHFDYIVTTDYRLFDNPNVIKIETEYNKSYPANTTLKNVTHITKLTEK